jgi:hypothetical protein
LISFSHRRVTGELHPDLTQSARDRQSIHPWPKGICGEAQTTSLHVRSLSRLLHTWPLTSSKSNSGETHGRLAKPWLVRIAFQLETHTGQSTIFSNVFRYPANPHKRNTKSKVEKTFPVVAWHSGSQQTLQETTVKKWQKN